MAFTVATASFRTALVLFAISVYLSGCGASGSSESPNVVWQRGGVLTSHTIEVRDLARDYLEAHGLAWGEPRAIAQPPGGGFVTEVRYDTPVGVAPRALIVALYGPPGAPSVWPK